MMRIYIRIDFQQKENHANERKQLAISYELGY